MNTKELADNLAMDAAGEIYAKAKMNRINEYSMRDDILSTIPLVELLECVDLLRDRLTLHQYTEKPEHCDACDILQRLDAKLGGKV